MSTFSWPAAWIPSAFELRVMPNLRAFVGAYAPTLQVLDMLGERWTGRLDLPLAVDQIEIGRRLAFFDRLHGRANAFAIPNFARRQPLGTARGSWTLAAAAAQLANVVQIAGCTNRNLLLGSSFEADANSDGRADAWSAYSAGSTGAVAYGLATAARVDGATSQRITATALGTSTADAAGVYQTISATALAGLPVVLSAYLASYDGTPKATLLITWRNGASTVRQDTALVSPSASMGRFSLVVTAPAGITHADVFVYATQRTGGAGVAVMDVDAVQLEQGSAATAYAPPPTLYAGDTFAVGGQFVRAMADAQVDGLGVMQVEIQPRLRAAMVSGTAVSWNAPTLTVRLKSGDEVPMAHQPGYTDGISLEFVEVV